MSWVRDLVAWADDEPDSVILGNGAGERQTVADFVCKLGRLQAAIKQRGHQRVAIWMPDSPEVVLAILAASGSDADVFLFHPELHSDVVVELIKRYGVGLCITRDGRDMECDQLGTFDDLGAYTASSVELGGPKGNASLYILTSGTTGTPKFVPHSWNRLMHSVRRRSDLTGVRWLSTYGITRYAGIQVLLQALLTRSRLIIPSERDVGAVVRALRTDQVTHASGTPSFWRRLALVLRASDVPSLTLQQLTLGGEACHQSTLDVLRRKFPDVRITHTYAATEVGVCFSASDGKEGFPYDQLEHNPRGVQCRVIDGELLIRSPAARSDVAPSEWIHTGDEVKVEGDRFYVVGRRDGCINVGGNKVYPEEVERHILDVPGVKEARVIGHRSSVLGQLVKAEVVAESGVDTRLLYQQILSRTRAHLEPYKVPRLITFMRELPLTAGGKLRR